MSTHFKMRHDNNILSYRRILSLRLANGFSLIYLYMLIFFNQLISDVLTPPGHPLHLRVSLPFPISGVGVASPGGGVCDPGRRYNTCGSTW